MQFIFPEVDSINNNFPTREQQNQGQRKYRSQVTGQEAASRKKKKNAPSDVDVSRLDVEEVRFYAEVLCLGYFYFNVGFMLR